MTLSISDIKRFAGLEGIRKRPTIYIGPTDSSGLWVLPRECLDNTVDRALAGQNDYTHFIEDLDSSLWVVDRGPGIPVEEAEFPDEHGRMEKLSGLYVVTGMLHAGSNFDSQTTSRGTHGIGQKATNALSTKFSVYTNRSGDWYSISYAKGKVVEKVSRAEAPTLPFGIELKNKGTVFHFTPDKSLFDKGARILPHIVEQWFSLTSYLVPNLDLYWTRRDGETRYFEPKGIQGFIDDKLGELKASPMGDTFTYSSSLCDIAISFSSAEGEHLSAYTNGLHNSEGGEHTRAVYQAIQRALSDYKGKLDFTLADVKDGIVGLVNAKLSAPKFNNQPKDKLVDDRIYVPLLEESEAALRKFFKANPQLAKDVVKKASSLHSLTVKHRMDRKLVTKVKRAAKETDHGKLAAVVGSAPMHERELFLVEGECLHGDTKVVILRHGEIDYIPIRELANLCSYGDKLPFVKSIDDSGRVYWNEIHKAWRTKRTRDIMEVTFALNGKSHSVTCTPNHPFLTPDNKTYIQAQFLSENTEVQCEGGVGVVVKASPVLYCQPTDVFDLEVSGEYPNFLLESGVFVHNSASGSGKKARDKTKQAIYALKGKPLNVMGATSEKIQANKEIIGLLSHLEIDLEKENTPTRYGKIIFAVDGDVDGDHIATLLMGLFWKFCPALFKQGKIYKVESPRYRCKTPKGTFFGNDRAQLRKTYGDSADITLLKGLGECNAIDLWNAILNPKTRTLTRITYPSRGEIAKFESLLGKGVEFRKEMLNLTRESSSPEDEES